jgi:hypothetical protein
MPSTATYSPTGDPYVDGVLSGIKWGVTSLTFSFPTDASFYGSGYPNGEPDSGFEAFNATQQAAVRAALNMYSAVANVTFTEITETSTQHAVLRYAESDAPSTAWAYYPSAWSESGGDAWFNHNHFNNPVAGNYAWVGMIHETGHAMGLKHPHEASGSFGTMPVDHDSVEYSVMSYRSYVGKSAGGYTNASDSYPQTLMMYDIAALQVEYGANYSTNSGDTVYAWSPTTGQMSIDGVAQALPIGNKVFLTTWDGGGNDTYDFSNYATNLSVDLTPGGWTTVSSTQLANLGSGHYAAGNIANSLLYNDNPASLIENAIGGSGDDTMVGNAADNSLTGGAGNDNLDGGSGTDTAVFSGNLADYSQVDNGDGSWTITDLRGGSPDGADTLTNIEQLQFSDGVVAIGDSPAVVDAPTIVSFSDDSGAAGDGITNDSTLMISGTAVANSTVTVLDGTTVLGTATADGSGAWSFTTASLDDGGHSFTATATNGDGTSDPSTALDVTVDTAAPTAPTIASFSDDSGVVGDGVTNDNTLTLSGSAEAGSTVTVYDGTTSLGTTTADGSGAWSYTTSVLADGDHSLTATATDVAGNTGAASAGLDLTVDTAAPGAPTVDTFSSDTGTAGDGITSDNTLTLGGTAEANSTVTVFDGGTVLGTAIADGGGWSFIAATGLTNGEHSFTATATDAAGNASAASSPLPVTIDAAPVATDDVATTGQDTPIDIDVLANDSDADGEVLSISGTPTALHGTVTVNNDGTLHYAPDAGYAGSDTITYVVSDGVLSDTGQVSLTVDPPPNTAPVA